MYAIKLPVLYLPVSKRTEAKIKPSIFTVMFSWLWPVKIDWFNLGITQNPACRSLTMVWFDVWIGNIVCNRLANKNGKKLWFEGGLKNVDCVPCGLVWCLNWEIIVIAIVPFPIATEHSDAERDKVQVWL